MAALLGLDYETGLAVTRQAQEESGDGAVCAVANDNGGGQVVASGTKASVDRAMEIAKSKGAKRSMLLSVSAPFHCPLMEPAARVMAEALAETIILPPRVPLVANVSAAPVTDPEMIRSLLVTQVTGTVRWRESILFMAEQGVDLFIECGSGKVLTGLLKRIAPKAHGQSIGQLADFEALRATLKKAS